MKTPLVSEQAAALQRIKELPIEDILRTTEWMDSAFSESVTFDDVKHFVGLRKEYATRIDDAHMLEYSNLPFLKHYPGSKEQIELMKGVEGALAKATMRLDHYLLANESAFKELLEKKDFNRAKELLEEDQRIREQIGEKEGLERILYDVKRAQETERSLNTSKRNRIEAVQHDMKALQEKESLLRDDYLSNLDTVTRWNAKSAIKDLLMRTAAYAGAMSDLETRADTVNIESIKKMAQNMREDAEHLEHQVGELYKRSKHHWKVRVVGYMTRIALTLTLLAGGYNTINNYLDRRAAAPKETRIETVATTPERQMTSEKRSPTARPHTSSKKSLQAVPATHKSATRKVPTVTYTLQQLHAEFPEKKLVIYNDLKKHRMEAYTLSDAKQLLNEPASYGKNPGPKERAGDKKTPYGVYQAERVIYNPKPPIMNKPNLFGAACITIKDKELRGRGVFRGIVLAGADLQERITCIQNEEDCSNGGGITLNKSIKEIANLVDEYGVNNTLIVFENQDRPEYKR